MHAPTAAVTLLWSYREMSGLSPVLVLEGTVLIQLSQTDSRELSHSSCGGRAESSRRRVSRICS